MSKNKKIEAEIEVVRKELLSKKAKDDYYLSEEVGALQDLVLYIHSKIETSMEILIKEDMETITRTIYSEHLISGKSLDYSGLFERLMPIFNSLNFTQKLNICGDRGLIPQKQISKIRQVNNYRNWFAHPHAYSSKMEEYKKQKSYLQVLKNLKKALEIIKQALS